MTTNDDNVPSIYRQKIDEAPTPYRYLSESDESDADCRKMRASSRDSNGSEGHRGAHVMFSNHLSTIPNTTPSTSTANPIGDSWEAVNAKLQYEKHLQDMYDCKSMDDAASISSSHQDILADRHNQRREFYSCSSSSNHDNTHSGTTGTTNNKPHRSSNHQSFNLPSNRTLVIDDIQTNFGEIINPAPAAFSPQFTR